MASPAVAQEIPPLEVLPVGPIALDGGTGTVTIVNNTDTAIPLTIHGELRADKAITVLDVQRAEPSVGDPSTLAPAGLAVFTVTGSGGSGTLTVKATLPSLPDMAGSPVLIIHRQVTVVKAIPKPAVLAWKQEISPFIALPFARQPADLAVPVEGSCPSPEWTSSPVFSSATHSAEALAKCAPGSNTMAVTATVPQVGTYTSELSLGGQKVALTVRSAAGWFWALLLAAIGCLAGLSQLGWLTNVRPFKRLRRRVEKLSEEAKNAQNSFHQSAERPQTAGYDIAAPTQRQADDLLARIDAAINSQGKVRRWLPRPAKEVEDATANLSAEAYEIEISVKDWPKAASLLKALPVAPPNSDLAPGLALNAARLRDTQGPSPLAPETIRPLLKDIEATTKFLCLLPEVALLEQRLAARSSQYASYPPTLQHWLTRARGNLTAAKADLASATTGASLLDTKMDRNLQDARDLEARLPTPPPAAPSGMNPEAAATQELTPISADNVILDGLRSKWAALAITVRRLPTADLLVLVAVAVTSIWAGMNLWYVGKAWGTVPDLITALAWGYGTVVVASPLVQAIERLTESDVQLKAKT